MNWNDEAEAIMRERFGGDSLIALATAADNIPWVRGVNATYQDPSADYSLVFEINGSQISVADQGDFPGANVSWEGVYRLE